MKITIYILHKTGEVYQKFADSESALKWMSRTGYLNHRITIVQKGNLAKVWEDCKDLRQLQKEIHEYLFPNPN
jgi:hypothetical protein